MAVLAAGCCEKYKCAVPAAAIVVRDQAGTLPPGTSVSIGSMVVTQPRCQSMDRCPFQVFGIGTAIVSAPGHKPVQVTIEQKFDDCGNGLTQQFEVVLVPETSSEQPTTKVGQAVGCG